MTAEELRPYFSEIGYRDDLLRNSVRLPGGKQRGLFGFSRYPYDARSACFAAVDAREATVELVQSFRDLGAPLVFVCHESGVEWWEQREKPVLCSPIPVDEIPRFFEAQSEHFAPSRIYRAKTDGRWDRSLQLTFVDVGLMPLAESEMGERVSSLIERCLLMVRSRLGDLLPESPTLRERLRQIFWLVGAKILRDKEVKAFGGIDLNDVSTALSAVNTHYRSSEGRLMPDEIALRDLEEAAAEVARFADLSVMTTEALAYIYENAGVSPETRRTLGTHSTPSYLVDYLVGRMRDWIGEIEPEERHVFEPACGHAPFLISASRLLVDLGGPEMNDAGYRHAYLQERLHGADLDDFALEIARLALTLTDIPNPDGWDLRSADVFGKDFLPVHVERARIVLGNPPYEKFSAVRPPESSRSSWTHSTMAQEFAGKVIQHLPPGGVLGMVLPAHFLHEAGSLKARRRLLDEFEVREIGMLPDNIFEYSSNETCLILARRKKEPTAQSAKIHFGRVREGTVRAFREDYRYESTDEVFPEEFARKPNLSLRMPRLWKLWRHLESMPKLADFGDLGQGLTHRGRVRLPEGTKTFEKEKFKGGVLGFWRVGRGGFSHAVPEVRWLNLDPCTIRRKLHGFETGTPQILFNKAPVSRGPWRLIGCIDKEGRPFLSNLFCFRPNKRTPNLDYWWALFNSPIFNAFAYCNFGKRSLEKSGLLKIPVPEPDPGAATAIISAARAYREAAVAFDMAAHAKNHDQLDKLRELHNRMDAAVLSAYDLPPDQERDLLRLYSGEKRSGVPFTFERYLPDYFESPIHLSDLLEITVDWDKTNELRGELIDAAEKRDLTPNEKNEYDRLQHLTDLQIELDAMPDLIRVREIERKLIEQGLAR